MTGDGMDFIKGTPDTAQHRLDERRWVESEWGTSDNGKHAKFCSLAGEGRRAE